MSSFEAYKLFLSIKMHFTQPNYDMFKYHGAVKANINSFHTRRDKYQFAKLAKHKDPQGLLVSNFVASDAKWIGDMFTEQAENVYKQWLARQQSLTYHVENELSSFTDDFIDMFKVVKGQHPKLLQLFKQGGLSIETLTILNNLLHFFPLWDKKIIDTIVWPNIRNRSLKYSKFLHYDVGKIKPIVKSMIAVSKKDKYDGQQTQTANTTQYVAHTTQ